MEIDSRSMEFLKKAWQRLEDFYNEKGLAWPFVGKPAPEYRPAIEDFVMRIHDGIYPYPETMAKIHNSFKLYLDSKGEISLDEAFFGNAHQKRISYAYKKFKARQFLIFHSQYVTLNRLLVEHEGAEKKSLEHLADQYLRDSQDSETDTHSFLKAYNRWKQEKDKRE